MSLYNGINKIIVQATRVKDMGYGKIGPKQWMFIDLQDGRDATVGYQYATKAELLADAERYLKEYGY